MKLFIEEVDTLDWVGKEYKVGMAKYSADVTFKRGGITYFIEFLDPYGSNMLAKWWDNSDNGVGYNNQGYVFVDNPFNRMTGYFSPENIDEYIKVDSDYGRKPNASIRKILIDKVKRQLDYDALNDVKSTYRGESHNRKISRQRITESRHGLPTQEEYDYWFNVGLNAFERGDKAIPAHSKEIRDYMKENPSTIGSKESKKTDKIIKAWIDGWTYGNLKVDID